MLAALAVTVCACSTVNEPMLHTIVVTPEISAEAQTPCAAPVTLPDRDLTEAEATPLWGADRRALRVCETRRAAAVGGSHVQ